MLTRCQSFSVLHAGYKCTICAPPATLFISHKPQRICSYYRWWLLNILTLSLHVYPLCDSTPFYSTAYGLTFATQLLFCGNEVCCFGQRAVRVVSVLSCPTPHLVAHDRPLLRFDVSATARINSQYDQIMRA